MRALRSHAELRWFLSNYLLLNVLGFVIGVAQGILLLVSSTDGSIPGQAGPLAVQVLWHAVSVVFFLPLFLGVPTLIVGLLAWRLAIRLVGSPRLAAYVGATFMVLLGAMLFPRDEPMVIGVWLTVALAYASIARLPPSDSPLVPPDTGPTD